MNHTSNTNNPKKSITKNEATQNTVQNTNMHPNLLSETKISNSPPYKADTQCIFFIWIILLLVSFLLFFPPR